MVGCETCLGLVFFSFYLKGGGRNLQKSQVCNTSRQRNAVYFQRNLIQAKQWVKATISFKSLSKTPLFSRERVRGCKRSAWEAWSVPSNHQISKTVSAFKETPRPLASFRCCITPWQNRETVSALRRKNKSAGHRIYRSAHIVKAGQHMNSALESRISLELT